MESELKCPLSAEELEQAKQTMLQFIWDWTLARYPNIRLNTIERNLSTLMALKTQDDNCVKCFARAGCKSDGYQMNGKLMADGVITIWMQPCPQGFAQPRSESGKQAKKEWKPNYEHA